MHKKATIKISSEFLVWLVFLLLVIATFLGAAYKIKDNRLHNLRVEARDYAFTRDAIESIPYSLDYRYKPNPNITLSLNEQNCQIEAKFKSLTVPPLTFSCGIDQFSTLKQQEVDKTIRITN